MKPDEYQAAAIRTECHNYEPREVIQKTRTVRLVHAALGLTTEASEFASHIRAWIYYGKKLDVEKLKDELGDILWFVALACEASGLSLEEVMKANIRKLLARFPEKFTTESYTNRDEKAERRAVSGFDPDLPYNPDAEHGWEE